MKRPHQLSRDELEDIVDVVQQTLYLDFRPDEEFFWNPDNEWDAADALDQIALKLSDHGMNPQNPEPFQPIQSLRHSG